LWFVSKLGNRLALHGVPLTWTVGGLVGFVGYRQMVKAVQREAVARVEDAVRVGQRVLTDFAREVAALAADDLASEALQRRMPVKIEGGPASAWGDPDLLRVVLDNLIGNAVKYGEEGTGVLVTLCPIGAGLRVEVTNHGIGIPSDRFSELFEKFHRLQDPRLRSRKGTGVGLCLVKRIVELHGGTVGVEGEYGKRIRFWFELPPPPELGGRNPVETPRAEVAP
jgi:signal transduction histidine kinase